VHEQAEEQHQGMDEAMSYVRPRIESEEEKISREAIRDFMAKRWYEEPKPMMTKPNAILLWLVHHRGLLSFALGVAVGVALARGL
jgi:hypothetical protein